MELFVVETCTWLRHWINEEIFISSTCDVVAVDSNSLELVALKVFKIIVASCDNWSSDPHSSQRLWSLGRTLEIDYRLCEILFDAFIETMDDMALGERLFVGDIQYQMIEGNMS